MILRIAAYVAVMGAVIWAIGEFADSPEAPAPLPRMPPMDEPRGDEGPAAEPEPEPAPEPADPPKKRGGLLGVPLG